MGVIERVGEGEQPLQYALLCSMDVPADAVRAAPSKRQVLAPSLQPEPGGAK
jgi:hypothetical protein